MGGNPFLEETRIFKGPIFGKGLFTGKESSLQGIG